MFIETSGECAIHFDYEAKCVTDTGYLFHRFGEEGAQMFKKGYSLYSAFYTQLAFYSQSAVCILPPVRSLQSAFYTDRFMFPPLPHPPPPPLISIDEGFYGAGLRDVLIGSVIVIEGRFF